MRLPGLGPNLLGRASMALIPALALPLLLKLYGVGGLGIITLFVALQALVYLADFGFGAALTREVARGVRRQSARRLFQGMFLALALIGVIVAFTFYQFKAGIAGLLLGAENNVQLALIAWIGLALGSYLPWISVQATLIGAGKFRFLNILLISASFTKFFAPAAAHLIGLTSLVTFFQVNLIVNLALISVGAAASASALALPSVSKEHDGQPNSLAAFSAGAFLAAVTGSILSQLDKILVGRVATLESLGIYGSAAMLSGGLYLLSTSVFMTMYTPLCASVGAADRSRTRSIMSSSTRTFLVLVLPMAAVFTVHPHAVLLAWTGSEAVASKGAGVLLLLTLGAILLSAAGLLRQWQYAHGRPGDSIIQNLAGLSVLAGGTYLLGAGTATAVAALLTTAQFVVLLVALVQVVIATDEWRPTLTSLLASGTAFLLAVMVAGLSSWMSRPVVWFMGLHRGSMPELLITIGFAYVSGAVAIVMASRRLTNPEQEQQKHGVARETPLLPKI